MSAEALYCIFYCLNEKFGEHVNAGWCETSFFLTINLEIFWIRAIIVCHLSWTPLRGDCFQSALLLKVDGDFVASR